MIESITSHQLSSVSVLVTWLLLMCVFINEVFHRLRRSSNRNVYLTILRHPWQVLRDSWTFSFYTVAEVADYVCSNNNDKKRAIIRFPFGRRTLFFSSPDSAAHVLSNVKAFSKYRFRFATVSGLQMLGMYERGLIWNNNLESWKCVRSCFHKTLSNSCLDQVCDIVYGSMDNILARMPIVDPSTRAINMLDALRWMTLNLTLELMLGLPGLTQWDDAKPIIEAIVDFFKAWEFYLVRPSFVVRCKPRLYRQHARARYYIIVTSDEFIRGWF